MMKNLKKKLAAFLAIVTLMTVGASAVSTATAERDHSAPVVTASEPQKKSEAEQVLEKVVEFAKTGDNTQPLRQLVNTSIDSMGDSTPEAKLAKDLTNQFITNNYSSVINLPGVGTANKIAQTALEIEKAASTQGLESAVHTVKAMENTADVIVKSFPGGDIVVATKDIAKSIGGYILDKGESAVVTIVNTASDAWNAVTDGICSLFSSSSEPRPGYALPQLDVDTRPAHVDGPMGPVNPQK